MAYFTVSSILYNPSHFFLDATYTVNLIPPNMQGLHAHLYLLLSDVSVPQETAPTHGVQWPLPPTSGQKQVEPTPVRLDLTSCTYTQLVNFSDN